MGLSAFPKNKAPHPFNDQIQRVQRQQPRGCAMEKRLGTPADAGFPGVHNPKYRQHQKRKNHAHHTTSRSLNNLAA